MEFSSFFLSFSLYLFIYLFGLMKLIFVSVHAQMLVFVCVLLHGNQKSILVYSCSPHWVLRSGISLNLECSPTKLTGQQALVISLHRHQHRVQI